ncbi:MAG: hypothetical protein ACOYO1_03545 [Bacteroidales bacterium]
MITKNKLDKSFGPVGTISGIIIFVAGLLGLIIVHFSFTGLLLVLIGSFVGFSSTFVLIDFAKKRVNFSNNLFGVIPYGKWIDIESGMKIGVKKSETNWRTYSSGNRTLDINDSDFRIILYSSDNKEIMPLMKISTLDTAKMEAEKFCSQLGLKMI